MHMLTMIINEQQTMPYYFKHFQYVSPRMLLQLLPIDIHIPVYVNTLLIDLIMTGLRCIGTARALIAQVVVNPTTMRSRPQRPPSVK
jgi:hypothetical protein